MHFYLTNKKCLQNLKVRDTLFWFLFLRLFCIRGIQVHLNLSKKGIRVLGISESFTKGFGEKSWFVGVVMRADLIIDGFGISKIKVRGRDATEKVIEIYKKMERTDIRAIILNGCVIALFNVIDLTEIFETLHLPVICVTYEESEGLEKYFFEFKDAEERLEIFKRNGEREPLNLSTGHSIFVNYLGIPYKMVKKLLDKFTLQGSICEPLRVARLIARSLNRFERGKSDFLFSSQKKS